jgi:hypothetical protein
MSKWLNSCLQKRGSQLAVSGLSQETEKNGATNVLTELTRGHQSAVSVPPEGLFPLDRDSLLYEFEERLAIAEYDGGQTPLHAHSILGCFYFSINCSTSNGGSKRMAEPNGTDGSCSD